MEVKGESKDTAHLHAPSKRSQQESDETAEEKGMLEARDELEEEAESDTVPKLRKPQARSTPARTKGHDFSSCF